MISTNHLPWTNRFPFNTAAKALPRNRRMKERDKDRKRVREKKTPKWNLTVNANDDESNKCWVISWRVNVTFPIETKLNQTAPYLYKCACVWAIAMSIVAIRAMCFFLLFSFIYSWIFFGFSSDSSNMITHKQNNQQRRSERDSAKETEWDWTLDKRNCINACANTFFSVFIRLNLQQQHTNTSID